MRHALLLLALAAGAARAELAGPETFTIGNLSSAPSNFVSGGHNPIGQTLVAPTSHTVLTSWTFAAVGATPGTQATLTVRPFSNGIIGSAVSTSTPFAV